MPSSAAPLRDADGLCIACARGEVGEAIGRIGTAERGGGRFEGYTDAAETEKKILRDVFAKGDAWFRTGDLMRRDEQGYFYFVDRVGDTFRWKGENVATSEVNDAMLECPGVVDVDHLWRDGARRRRPRRNGGDRGRSGVRSRGLRADIWRGRLPAYAQPLFLRISAALDATETFKQKKQQLVREGFDPAVVRDPLYVRDPQSGVYRPIDRGDIRADLRRRDQALSVRSRPFGKARARKQAIYQCGGKIVSAGATVFTIRTLSWRPKLHQEASPPMSVKSRIIAAMTADCRRAEGEAAAARRRSVAA